MFSSRVAIQMANICTVSTALPFWIGPLSTPFRQVRGKESSDKGSGVAGISHRLRWLGSNRRVTLSVSLSPAPGSEHFVVVLHFRDVSPVGLLHCGGKFF